MKQLEYLYFNIFCYISKRVGHPGIPVVRLQTMFLISLSAGGWILLVQLGILRLVRNVWFSSQGEAMIFALMVYLVFSVMFYRIFIVKEHDQRIFDRFLPSWERNPNKKRDLLISAGLMKLPYLLIFLIKIYFPR